MDPDFIGLIFSVFQQEGNDKVIKNLFINNLTALK